MLVGVTDSVCRGLEAYKGVTIAMQVRAGLCDRIVLKYKNLELRRKEEKNATGLRINIRAAHLR